MQIRIVPALLCCFSFTIARSQQQAVMVRNFYPKDSTAFNQEVKGLRFNDKHEQYGKTTMIIHAVSPAGIFDMVFKKNIHQLRRMIDFEDKSVSELYNFKTKAWEHEEGSWSYSDVKGMPKDTVIISTHDLYCFIYRHEATAIAEVARFQDFGNVVYWPEFDYPQCTISDEDKNGVPEFYLSYMGYSDGLDAQPYKQIVYTGATGAAILTKAKATAYYPNGNEDDHFHIEYDTSWKQLPQAVKTRSRRLIDKNQMGSR